MASGEELSPFGWRGWPKALPHKTLRRGPPPAFVVNSLGSTT
jgi:hypothetical protein